ncbi:MAG: AHH domain-containing protein [Altererythrobacter sp.]|nr:AHH domain-containing protein [Altererythrobacter sp.]
MVAAGPETPRQRGEIALSFAAVNRAGRPGHIPDLQRHHLLPRQAMRAPALQGMWSALGHATIGFDDFRRNGILLPSGESAVLRLGLPLHLGPHQHYNAMVLQRLGTIEAGWAQQRPYGATAARAGALLRIRLLQSALRRRILDTRRPLAFNRRDPLGHGRDFTVLDRLAEDLWLATEI